MAHESYLLPSELPTYYDSRRVLQLASDTDTPALIADLSNAASTPYSFVISCIRWAASEIDQHCQQGRRYNRTDLEGIIDAALNGTPPDPPTEPQIKRAGVLRQLVADLAYGCLISRRGMSAPALKQLCPRYEQAQGTLEKLALGVQVFDLDPQLNAGVPQIVPIGANVYRPSLDNRMFGQWYDWPYGNGNNRSFYGVW